MTVFKCKMCGGDLTPVEGSNTCECEFCGTLQTIATADNEKKVNLFNRANRLRLANDFDKSASVYESIVAEFPEEAEAYWGLCLCKYGIEYVDDPATGKKVATCHRASYESIFDDSNFDMALEYADTLARNLYREEAKYIDRIQKAILEIAQKEDPFDIFICYKETDENGDRTKDSVLAQDIYDALTDKGYKVFFSRITLEDRLGQEYEPYIFSALNTAKVMLAIGTSYDYYQAPWVKNEWSRYLALMKNDKSKTLIPCYADIDAYDMPNEFRNLQGQDMGKIGFMQDLVRGINKLFGRDKIVQTAQQMVVTQSGTNVAALLKRGEMALEDGMWSEAEKYYNDVLNINAECYDAYLGLSMAIHYCQNKTLFAELFIRNGVNDRYIKRAKQFSQGTFKAEIEDWEERRQKALQLQLIAQLIRLVVKKKKAEEEVIADEKRKKEAEKKRIEQEMRRRKEEEELAERLRIEQKNIKKVEEERSQKIKELRFRIQQINSQEPVGECSDVKKEIIQKEAYLKTLGMFKGKEKQATKKEIEKLKTRLQERKKELSNQLDIITGLSGKTGDIVSFGHVLNDKNTKIVWQVLDVQGSRKLLIAKHFVSKLPYNSERKNVTWETSTIRKWLNEEFFENAFSDFEKGIIVETIVKVEPITKYKTSPDRETKDRVFLLSIKEVETYFKSDLDRSCAGEWWWLRTPSRDCMRVADICGDGSIDTSGSSLISKSGIRPAIWVDVDLV